MRFWKRVFTIFSVFTLIMLFAASCKKEVRLSNTELLNKASEAAASPEADGWKKAMGYAGKAVSQNNKDVNALIMLAIAEEKCESFKKALSDAKEAAVLAPDSFMAQYTYGRMLFYHERREDCIAPLMNAIRIRPNSANTAVFLAKANLELGNYDKAMKYYVKLAKNPTYKDDAALWNELGVIFTKKNQAKKALKCFQRAYKRDKENPSIILNIAIFVDKTMKKPKAAYKYYSMYIKLVKNNPSLHLKREQVIKRINQIKKTL